MKPVDSEDLLQTISRAKLYRSAGDGFKNLDRTCQHLDATAHELLAETDSARTQIGSGEFLALSVRNIASALENITALASVLADQDTTPVCQMMRCPRVHLLKGTVEKSIDVLEDTKKSFKSKKLGRLRKHLETILELVEEDALSEIP